MENRDDKVISPEEQEKFKQELAAALNLSALEDFPNELTVTEEPIPDLSRWLE